MPILTSYTSTIATLNADGSLSLSGLGYDWDGTQFKLRPNSLSSTFSKADVDSFVHLIAADTNAGPSSLTKYSYDGTTAHAALLPDLVAELRLAIDRGETTLAQALSVWGKVYVGTILPFGFLALNPPQTLSAAQEATVLRADFGLQVFTLADLLTKPNPFVADSAIAKASDSWTVPAGASTNAAIAGAWQDSNVGSVAALSKAYLGLTDGSDAGPAGQHVVPYGISVSTFDTPIEKLYLAYFLRPADSQGYLYNASILGLNGGDVIATATTFGGSAEYQALYAGFSTASGSTPSTKICSAGTQKLPACSSGPRSWTRERSRSTTSRFRSLLRRRTAIWQR